tara:strand:- start:643 stop:885 length:243 start_codon:yes stop_codon:yes gene_type:complete
MREFEIEYEGVKYSIEYTPNDAYDGIFSVYIDDDEVKLENPSFSLMILGYIYEDIRENAEQRAEDQEVRGNQFGYITEHV